MSERAQVELDYSARMEALGRKYSNSITAAAQNPLLTHPSTQSNAASTQGAGNDAAKASKTGKTPSKPTTAAVPPGPATPTVPLSASAVSRSFHTITSLGGVLSASKPTAGAEAANTPGSPEEEDPELDNPVGRHRTARAGNLWSVCDRYSAASCPIKYGTVFSLFGAILLLQHHRCRSSAPNALISKLLVHGCTC
jgi:hypothetical protein